MDNLATTKPFVATSRFGLGGSRKDLNAIGSAPIDWIEKQLAGGIVTINGMPDASERLAALQQYQRERRASPNKRDPKARRAFRQEMRVASAEQIIRRFEQAVTTPFPVRERLALFWSNHFSVSHQGKPQLAATCASFENEAIRPNLDNHFAHLLLAVASHPTMLLYLDNAQSIGPDSPVGKGHKAGMNENYAREILELHTLGVAGGYSQDDVIGLARILTGWTLGNDRLKRAGATPGEFVFVEHMHQPGTHRLLGKDYKPVGRNQGIEALRDLALHPSTARHVATKLVRHFVSDQPAERDIQYVADIFLKTDGHLPSMHKAAITLTSAWSQENRKLKTPYELLVSIFRGLDLPIHRPEPVLNTLRLTNHLPFTAPSPEGWPDTTEHWGSPALLKQRVEFGVAMGMQAGNGIDANEASTWLLDTTRSEELIASVGRASSPSQGLALLLASPDFQWR